MTSENKDELKEEPKTRKGQATKTKMVEVAAQLIHRNGMTATTVNDILEASGTGKSQFSHYFGSKTALVTEVLAFHARQMAQVTREIFSDIESVNDLKKWIDFMIEIQKQCLEQAGAGCPLGQISMELSKDDQQLRAEVLKAYSAVENELAEALQTLKRKGKIDNQTDPLSLAKFLSSVVQGSFLISKINCSSAPTINSFHHAYEYVKSLGR